MFGTRLCKNYTLEKPKFIAAKTQQKQVKVSGQIESVAYSTVFFFRWLSVFWPTHSCSFFLHLFSSYIAPVSFQVWIAWGAVSLNCTTPWIWRYAGEKKKNTKMAKL